MTADLLDRRVLGALRFMDSVTGLPVTGPLRVEAEGVRWIRNRSGHYVIASAPGLEHHPAEFAAPPAAPPVGSIEVPFRVEDPEGRYLPRGGVIRLPRDPGPAAADSLLRVREVPLFLAPAAALWPGWAVVRASVAGAEPGSGLAGALIRVLRQRDGALLARALSDGRGEALVAVHGVPVASFGDGRGRVLVTEVPARLEVVWDPAGEGAPDPESQEARAADPARRSGLLIRSSPVQLASGRVAAMVL